MIVTCGFRLVRFLTVDSDFGFFFFPSPSITRSIILFSAFLFFFFFLLFFFIAKIVGLVLGRPIVTILPECNHNNIYPLGAV